MEFFILKKIIKYILILAAAYLVYIVASLIISAFIFSDEEVDFEFTLADGGERVCSVDENTDALALRLAAIYSAEEEIIISTFKIEQDDSSCTVLAALYEAAERGVSVKIIIDGMNAQIRLYKYNEFKVLAAHENVEVKYYNRINFLKPWLQNYHLHDKYIIVDDSLYILGGRNIAEMALSEYENSNTDRDVLVYETGSGSDTSLAQLKEYFEMVWNLDVSEYAAYRCSEKKMTEALENLKEHYTQAEAVDWESITYEASSIMILTNPVNAATTSADVWDSVCALMAEGENVLIQTPYIMCDSSMYEDLTAVCGTADVEMIINSPVTGSNIFGSADYLNQKEKIYAIGVTTYEWYGGGHSSHAKTILIDDNICIIGSYNFDMRSNYLDTEIMLVIDCPELNAQLRAEIEELKSESKIISPDGTVTYGGNFEDSDYTAKKKVLYAILRVIEHPFRRML